MKLLVLSAHADDETLGAGGMILRFKSEGHSVYWVNVTMKSEANGYTREETEKREMQVNAVTDAYCFDAVFQLGLRPAGIDEVPVREIVNKVSNIFNEVRPDTIVLPYGGDVHSDHRIVFEAGFAAAKLFRHPCIKRVLTMEVISETSCGLATRSFSPSYYLDISDFIERKIEISSYYADEFHEHPFPRSKESLRALALLRGAQANCCYAEGFEILRMIE